MQDAQDFNGAVSDAVERKIFPQDQVADTWSNVFARRTGERMQSQQAPSRFKSIHQANRSKWIVGRDIVANSFKVDFRLRKQAVFHSWKPLASAILRYFARNRSMIGCPSSAGPLSIPSCTSLRNSSSV